MKKKEGIPMNNLAVKEFGAKVTKKMKGWYIYNGVNFTVEIFEDSCETSWWEVVMDGEIHPAVIEEIPMDYNNFNTKSELVFLLLQIDKELSK